MLRRGGILASRPGRVKAVSDTSLLGHAPGWVNGGVAFAENRPLIDAGRRELAARADPSKAKEMQAYMKSSMPYRGVRSPDQRRVFRRAFADHPLEGFDEWRDTVLALWREAEFREERYGAIALAGDRRYRGHQTPEALPIYEEMVTTGAWWDFVDAVAVHQIGDFLRSRPDVVRPEMEQWSGSPDVWKRRAALICQVLSKDATDLDLLYACIERNLADRDFFIRKAIGWALRAYAWVDPDEVLRYAREKSALSGLSRREALKNIVN